MDKTIEGDQTENKDLVKIESVYVAPWALPNEELPIHMFIEPSSKFDLIRIHLPRNVKVKEYFNVELSEEKDTEITIKKLATPDFFGFTIYQNLIFEETKHSENLLVQFEYMGKVVGRKSILVTFYRPHVSLISSPSSIEILDKGNLEELVNIKMKVMGFGDIEIRIETGIGEKYKVNLEDFFRDVARRVVSSLLSLSPSAEGEEDIIEETGLDIDAIAETATNLWEQIWPSPISKERNSVLEKFKDWLKLPEVREIVLSDAFANMEEFAIDWLLYNNDRYPDDRIDMKSGRPFVPMEKVANAIRIKVRYWDSYGNEYPSLEFPIDVHDKRSEERPIRIPINIEWTIEPYHMEEC